MDILDLLVNCRILCFLVKEQTFYIIFHRRNSGILADVKSLDQTLALTILRYKSKTVFDLGGNIFDI